MNDTRLFIYTRKSSDSEERQVLFIEAQLRELRQYAEREKFHICSEFTESQSAKDPGRPVFNELLSRIKKGEANGILAWHPDRLSRNLVQKGIPGTM